MSSVAFYSMIEESDREEILLQVRQAVNRAEVGRNDPCPCQSGKKFKKCHAPLGRAATGDWFGPDGRFLWSQGDWLEPEVLRRAEHLARIARAREALKQGGGLESLPGEPGPTESALYAATLRENPEKGAELLQCLQGLLVEPLDLCLDYQRIVHDLIQTARAQEQLDAAVQAQRWWIDFLKDFGQHFFLRTEAIKLLHELQVEAGHSQDTLEALTRLQQEFLPSTSHSRSLLEKMSRGENS